MSDRNSKARREGISALFKWLLNRTVIQDRNNVMKKKGEPQRTKRAGLTSQMHLIKKTEVYESAIITSHKRV